LLGLRGSRLPTKADMEIHFISSLTSEDETKVAAAILAAAGTVLDQSAIAYSLRIETSSGEVLQRTGPVGDASAAADLPPEAQALAKLDLQSQ